MLFALMVANYVKETSKTTNFWAHFFYNTSLYCLALPFIDITLICFIYKFFGQDKATNETIIPYCNSFYNIIWYWSTIMYTPISDNWLITLYTGYFSIFYKTSYVANHFSIDRINQNWAHAIMLYVSIQSCTYVSYNIYDYKLLILLVTYTAIMALQGLW